MKRHLWALLALSLAVTACTDPPPAPPKALTMAEARDKVLTLFRQLDGFQMERQREVGLQGSEGIRMEARWNHEGQKRRGIIFLVEHPKVFNVIHFTAPDDDNLFDVGRPFFDDMLKDLRVYDGSGALSVKEQGERKVLNSPELKLSITYPADWVYTLDDLNRALVFSGPRQEPTWLTTVSFSIIHKWEMKP